MCLRRYQDAIDYPSLRYMRSFRDDVIITLPRHGFRIYLPKGKRILVGNTAVIESSLRTTYDGLRVMTMDSASILDVKVDKNGSFKLSLFALDL